MTYNVFGGTLNLAQSIKPKPFSRGAITTETRSHPEMVGDMSRVTLNFDLSKIPFVHFEPGSRPILTLKIKHVYLLVLI